MLPVNQVVCGNCLEVMSKWPAESVNFVMFSPPYYGHRNYGPSTNAIWGGNPGCEHSFDKSGLCSKCGAWYGQLGLEPDFHSYVEHLVMVGREIRRILRKDGSWWLNLGDTYAGSLAGYGAKAKSPHGIQDVTKGYFVSSHQKPPQSQIGIPPKCKVLIPHRVAIALIDDGWSVRNDSIWYKPNAMPESTKDRLANKFEFVFHLVKSHKTLYWTNEKIRKRVDERPPGTQGKENIDWEWVECFRCEGTGKIKDEVCKKCKGRGKVKRNLWQGHCYYYDLDAIREPHKGQGNRDRLIDGKKSSAQYSSGEKGFVQTKTVMGDSPLGKNPGDILGVPKSWGVDKQGEYHGQATKDYKSAGAQNPSDTKRRIIESQKRHPGRGKNPGDVFIGDTSVATRVVRDRDYKTRDPARHVRADGMKNPGDVAGYSSKYSLKEHGQTLQGLVRTQSIFKERQQSRIDAKKLYPDDPEKQQEHINLIHDHSGHPLGPNPGDVIKTKWRDPDSPTVEHFREKGSGGHYDYGGLHSPEGKHLAKGGRNPGDVVKLTKHDEAVGRIGDYSYADPLHTKEYHPLGANPGDFWSIKTTPSQDYWCTFCKDFVKQKDMKCVRCGKKVMAHFAVYCTELCRNPIKSSCPAQVCKKCGMPRERIQKRTGEVTQQWGERESKPWFQDKREMPQKVIKEGIYETTGFTDCKCGVGFEGGIVLDPMCGSGTTLVVAKRMGLRYIGIDLNPDYVEMARKRLSQVEWPLDVFL